MSFCVFDDFFCFSKQIGFLGILGPPYCGIGATIRIGQEMLFLPYAGFVALGLGMAIALDIAMAMAIAIAKASSLFG